MSSFSFVSTASTASPVSSRSSPSVSFRPGSPSPMFSLSQSLNPMNYLSSRRSSVQQASQSIRYNPDPVIPDETIHIVIILDRSGSMSNNRFEMIDAINKFIKDQQYQSSHSDQEGIKQQIIKVSLIQFNHEVSASFICRSLDTCVALTSDDYHLDGSTALYDALGLSIHQFGACNNVIMVVVTDGDDNMSHEYTKASISSLIKEKREKKYWDVHYLCADESGFSTGQDLHMTSNVQTAQTNIPTLFSSHLTAQVMSSRSSPMRQSPVK